MFYGFLFLDVSRVEALAELCFRVNRPVGADVVLGGIDHGFGGRYRSAA